VAAAVSAPAGAAPAHEHGVARIDVAVEATRISVQFESPLDNLLGFERAPRTDAERAAAAAVVANLRAATRWLRIDPAAGCDAGVVVIESAALLPDPSAAAAAVASPSGHAELEASVSFRCQAGAAAAFVETHLFKLLPRLARLEVQVAGPKGQLKTTLLRPASRVPLAR
jgi:hypothetical protein